MTADERILAELQEIRALLTVIAAQVQLRGAPRRHSVAELGWSREEALAVRNQLLSFESDWNAPGMEAYDEL